MIVVGHLARTFHLADAMPVILNLSPYVIRLEDTGDRRRPLLPFTQHVVQLPDPIEEPIHRPLSLPVSELRVELRPETRELRALLLDHVLDERARRGASRLEVFVSLRRVLEPLGVGAFVHASVQLRLLCVDGLELVDQRAVVLAVVPEDLGPDLGDLCLGFQEVFLELCLRRRGLGLLLCGLLRFLAGALLGIFLELFSRRFSVLF